MPNFCQIHPWCSSYRTERSRVRQKSRAFSAQAWAVESSANNKSDASSEVPLGRMGDHYINLLGTGRGHPVLLVSVCVCLSGFERVCVVLEYCSTVVLLSICFPESARIHCYLSISIHLSLSTIVRPSVRPSVHPSVHPSIVRYAGGQASRQAGRNAGRRACIVHIYIYIYVYIYTCILVLQRLLFLRISTANIAKNTFSSVKSGLKVRHYKSLPNSPWDCWHSPTLHSSSLYLASWGSPRPHPQSNPAMSYRQTRCQSRYVKIVYVYSCVTIFDGKFVCCASSIRHKQ